MIALDLEATGTDPMTDRITQFGIVTHDGRSWTSLVDPEREIPAEVVELTGITNEAVAKAPKFEFFADTLAELITDRPLVVYNGLRFDVPLLAEEFERAGVNYKFGPIIDVDALFKQHHTRTLTDAVRVYLGESHEEAHSALADAKKTLRVFNAMVEAFPKLSELKRPNTSLLGILDAAALMSCHGKRPADPHGILVYIDGVMCFTHKKVRGVPVEQDTGYAAWILRSDFPASTKRVLSAELERIHAKWIAEAEAAEKTAAEEVEIVWPDQTGKEIPF